MALSASATARSPFPPPPSFSSLPSKISVPNIKIPPKTTQLQDNALLVSLTTSTTLSILALFTPPSYEARAISFPKEQIFSSLNQVELTFDRIQDVSSSVFDVSGNVIGTVVEFVKPGIDVALHILNQAGEKALKLASPVISEASKKAQEAIQSSGIDTEPVITAAKTVSDVAQQTSKVIDDAKPIASSTVENISSADPITVLGAGGALFIAYLLLPPVFSAISFTFRGYKGDLTPTKTPDLMSTKDYILIDIRSKKDKDKARIPRLPSNAKSKIISIPLEELPSKLKSLVRSVKKVEAELVALKISHLKKINKDSDIVILDSYSDTAKMVARTLTNIGFKNSWIVSDGFSGSKGWLQSRLGTDSTVYPLLKSCDHPKSSLLASATRFGTTSSAKLLPGSSDLLSLLGLKKLERNSSDGDYSSLLNPTVSLPFFGRKLSISRGKSSSGTPRPQRFLNFRSLRRAAVDTPFGGNIGKYFRISVWDPYKRLGISRNASEEEVWSARNFLLNQYSDYERSFESIEAAFERILMASFWNSKKTKINLKSQLKQKVFRIATLVKNLLSFVQLPPGVIILRRLFLFGFMACWSVMNSADA